MKLTTRTTHAFKIKPSKIEMIEPDYEGIAKVLAEFEKLYKVCEN